MDKMQLHFANGDTGAHLRRRLVNKTTDLDAQEEGNGDVVYRTDGKEKPQAKEFPENDFGPDTKDDGVTEADKPRQENPVTGDYVTGLVQQAWKKAKTVFDTNAAPGRTGGFSRIDPVCARKLHDEMYVDDGGSSSDSEWENSTEKNDSADYAAERLRRRRTRIELLRKQRQEMLTIGMKKFEVEKIGVFLCALTILIGYPLCYYLQFYKGK